MAQITIAVDVLITRKTHNGNIGNQNPIAEFKTFKRDDNNHITSYGGREKTLER